MQGLILGDGPVAEYVPSIRDNLMVELRIHDPAVMQEYRGMADRVIRQVIRDNSEFSEQFRSDVLSGDHVRIQLAMHDAALLVQEVFQGQPEFAELSGDDGRGLCGLYAVAAAVVVYVLAFNAAAVALNVVAAANVYAAVAVETTVGVSRLAASNQQGLVAEQIVQDVALLSGL